MLRRIARLLGRGRHSDRKETSATPPLSPSNVSPLEDNPSFHSHPQSANRDELPPRVARLYRVPLNKLGLFGPTWRQRLTSLGIDTAAQFISVTNEQWQQLGMTEAEIRKLRRWEKAVRMASAMPSMKPYEAMMLLAIHRRRRSRLASELPGRLHRDLHRFSLSSPGQRLLRSRPVPDRQRVEAWIQAARAASNRLVGV